MTAANLFLQPTAGHLVTDGAVYDSEGVIRHIASKVVEAPAIHFACTFLGMVDQERIANALQHRASMFGLSQEAALQSLGPIAADLRLENASLLPEMEERGLTGFAIIACTWDHSAGRPRGWIVQTENAPQQLAEPYTLTETPGYMTPDVPLPVDPATGELSGLLHGREVLEAQRRHKEPDGCHIVGGFGECTTVTAAGVEKVRLVDWQDKLGDRIAA